MGGEQDREMGVGGGIDRGQVGEQRGQRVFS